MTVHLRDNTGNEKWETPLTWRRTKAYDDTPSEPLVVCENGHVARLRGWVVAADGSVTPSILCRTPMAELGECGWHEFVILDGWGKP